MKAKLLIALIFSLMICGEVSTWAKEICKGNSRVIGPCIEVRGRLSFYQGFPGFRMWWVGTKRIFGIAGGEGEEIIPEDIKEKVDDGIFVFGDFLVCPITEHIPGHMQYVCVESGKNLYIEDTRRKTDMERKEPPSSAR